MFGLSAARSSERLSFAHYLRTGVPLPEEAFTSLETKFDPYHDPTNGQFTFGPSDGTSKSYIGMTSKGLGIIKPTSGGGRDGAGRPVPEQFPPDAYALNNPASALAHYAGGSGEDRNYYFNEVDTAQVHLADFPELAKLVRVGKPGIYPIINVVGSYNGDFSGLYDTTSWATVGGLSLRANGTLEIRGNGSYHFSGRLSAVTDQYDFNKRAGRAAGAERLTAVGRHISGRPFLVHMIGSKPYSASGRR